MLSLEGESERWDAGAVLGPFWGERGGQVVRRKGGQGEGAEGIGVRGLVFDECIG